MNKNNGHQNRVLPITEQATGEYPILEIQDAIEPTSAKQDAPAPAKAASCLAHLEDEIHALQAKWQLVAAEFGVRETRIAELQAEIEARKSADAPLIAELQRAAAALMAADEHLTAKDQEIAALIEDREKRDERIAALATDLADAEVEHNSALERAARAEAETARLNDALRDAQAAATTAGAQNQELVGEQTRLRSQIQDLEAYINGRHERWCDLDAQLADQKDALRGLERTLKERDAAVARHDEEKAQLAARILELETQGTTLAGRLAERERAYEEAQERLTANAAQIEQLESGRVNLIKEGEETAKKAASAQTRINALELTIKQRNETIGALNAEIERGAAALSQLIATKDDFAKRIDGLEKSAVERSQQVQLLGNDLRLAQQELSDRTAQLASNQQALDQELRHVERLTNDLSQMNKSAGAMRAEIEKLEAKSAELEQRRTDAASETELIRLEVATQRTLIERLENELRAKRATEELLERSVARITDLGASLAALDEQMSDPAVTDSPAAPPVLRDYNDDEVIDIGTPIHSGTIPKLTATIDGQRFTYPIVGDVMTIGRDHASDIRIVSHYVSRIHAKIRTNESETIIEDAGSKNGVLVNSQRISSRVLRHGDVVSIAGEHNFRFVAS